MKAERAREQRIHDVVARQLDDLKRSGIIQGSESVEIASEHDKKSWKGRAWDWVLWKTPLKRWTRKQYRLVEVSLVEEMESLNDRVGFMQDPEDWANLLEACQGITYLKKEYPSNPYEVVLVSASIQPVVPLKFIKSTALIELNSSGTTSRTGRL